MIKKQLSLIFFLIVLVFTFFSYTNRVQLDEENEEAWLLSTFSKMTLDERIGQFFFVDIQNDLKSKQLKEAEALILKNKIGGIIFHSPELLGLSESINNSKTISKIPLFIGLEGEIENFKSYDASSNFPTSFTLGVANDKIVNERIARVKAEYIKELGFNYDFTINGNLISEIYPRYENRFGENPLSVSRLVSGSVLGMESQGVSTSINDFPGIGSMEEINNQFVLNESRTALDAVNLLPFREAIKAGVSSLIMSNVSVQAIDSSNLPMSLSRKAIDYIRGEMGFKGLLIANQNHHIGLKKHVNQNKFALEAYKAGCDLFIGVIEVEKSIKEIELAVLNGEIDIEELNKRCIKILKLKYNRLIKTKESTKLSIEAKKWARNSAYENGFVVFKNENETLPLKDFTEKYIHVSIGPKFEYFVEGIDRFKKIDHYHFYTVKEAEEKLKDKLGDYDHFILTLHENEYSRNSQSILKSGWAEWLKSFPASIYKSVIAFTSPLNMDDRIDLSSTDAFVLSFENNDFTQERLSQFVVGAIGSKGQLSFKLSDKYKRGFGLEVSNGGRLKFADLEEFKIDELKLAKIDSIVAQSIRNKVFPGCQVFVAVDGKVLYNKSFGKPMYKDSVNVDNSNLYDIASVTKVAASTIALMRLESQGKIDMNKKLKDYLPELVEGSEMASICLKDMMTHQAGLPAWIPFYLRTIKGGVYDSSIYSPVSKPGYQTKVAEGLFVLDTYTDTIYKRILKSKLEAKTYKYSDLGYYFVKKIVEKETGVKFDSYLRDSIYLPMGLTSICYKPLDYFPLHQIIPTENDSAFRKQVVRGYVHDPGAALLGGVGGHAGLFATASDLGALMQMVLNNGKYGNVQYIDSAVIKKYTSCQFCETNRRGLGFDRPNRSGGGTCDKIASQSSYGHSGFTGTLVWSDPKYNINYVFLSNRVYPSAENWKIVEQNVRTNIQKAIYEAVFDAKTKMK